MRLPLLFCRAENLYWSDACTGMDNGEIEIYQKIYHRYKIIDSAYLTNFNRKLCDFF